MIATQRALGRDEIAALTAHLAEEYDHLVRLDDSIESFRRILVENRLAEVDQHSQDVGCALARVETTAGRRKKILANLATRVGINDHTVSVEKLADYAPDEEKAALLNIRSRVRDQVVRVRRGNLLLNILVRDLARFNDSLVHSIFGGEPDFGSPVSSGVSRGILDRRL